MDKQGRQEHRGPVQNVPRWLSLSQASLSLNSERKPLVLIFRVGKLYAELRMTSPSLLIIPQGRSWLTSCPLFMEMVQQRSSTTTHTYLWKISSFQSWRGMQSQVYVFMTIATTNISENEHCDVLRALHSPSNLILTIILTGSCIYLSCFRNGEIEAWKKI